MIPFLLTLQVALISGMAGADASAAARAACEDWGQVSPDERIVYVGETVTLYVVDGNVTECGDSDRCEWSVDDDQGQLSATSGSPVDWTAPDSLTDCLPITLRVYVECPGVPAGSVTVDLRCTDEQRAELLATRGSTIAAGGGGTSGRAAALLLPALGLLRIRRRRYHSSP